MRRKRFGVLICHRRFGKSVLGINHLLYSLHDPDLCRIKHPPPAAAVILPTIKQAKNVAWGYAQHYARAFGQVKVNQTELKITFESGATFRLYGTDYPDALRGIYLDHVFLDEFDMMPESVFSEIIRPLLADRQGRCYMSGTPSGRGNLFQYSQQARRDRSWFTAILPLSDTQLIPQDEVDAIKRLIASGRMSQDEYDREFECSFSAGSAGSYWAREMLSARDQGRVSSVPHDPSLPVHTAWDLGIGAANQMAIWFLQTFSGQVRFIDYYEVEGCGFPDLVKMLAQKQAERGFTYGTHWAPHDIQTRELGTGKSRLEQAADLGLRFTAVPRVRAKADSIEAARRLVAVARFDEDRCRIGIDHLEQYSRTWSQDGRVWSPTPRHDWHSNGADAFQQAAMVVQVGGASVPAIGGTNNPFPVRQKF